MELEFEGEIIFWKGPSPFYFVPVPAEQGGTIRAVSELVTYGWGVIPVDVQIGRTRWKTSLFPKDGTYLVPIRANVRKAEKLGQGDIVFITLSIDL